MLDVVGGAEERPGGAVWYAARALAQIDPDADAVLACRSAPGDRDAVMPSLQGFGFPVHWRPAERTTRFSFHYDGDRRVMEIGELAEPWSPADIDGWVAEAIGDASWVIVGALTRIDFPLETLAALTARGHQLILDAQGLVRHGRLGPLQSDGSIDRRMLGHITALKLNDEEAEELCGGTDEAALRTLGIPEVVLTLGSDGALIVSGDVVTRVDAVPVDGPVDPTGAGDSFLLAYLHARQGGAEPHEAESPRAASSRRSSRADGCPCRDGARLRAGRSRRRRGRPRRGRAARPRDRRALAAARRRRAQVGSRIVAVVDRRPPLLLSDDGGLTWREVGGGLPSGAAIAIDEDNPDPLLYASESRLFLSEDGGLFWRGLPTGADRDHRGRVLVGLADVGRTKAI